MHLNLDIDNFLAEYWQQKPLLIRNAVSNFSPPIDADELAGLAMEEAIESRIIDTVGQAWQLTHGPFKEADFDREYPWTLLVQAVDHHVQEVADLLKLVDFIPSWRVDDVMVSFASDGGSVGPHYDNYDVFLLQGEGKRRWRLGQTCHSGSALVAHPDLRVLANFDCTHEYTLEAGDVLYVPPGVAHWGVAQGSCTTFSLGFRAPRVNDMLSRHIDELLEDIDPEQFYGDAQQSAAALPGEIRDEDIARMAAQLAAALAQSSKGRWFGELVTEPRFPLLPDDDELAEGRILLQLSAAAVTLLPGAKLAWQSSENGFNIYANGEAMRYSKAIRPLILTLCRDHVLEGDALSEALTSTEGQALLQQLLAVGCIIIE